MFKGKTPLLIALVLAVGAAGGAKVYLARERARIQEGWNLVPVVVAAQDIAEGTVLDFDMISQRNIPEQFVSGSVIKPENANYVVGQKVSVSIQQGDPLLWSQFNTMKGFEGLSNLVTKRARGVSINVSTNQAVAQWVRPNDHVDVLGTMHDPKTQESMTLTLLQNVVVLATGQITGQTNYNLLPEDKRSFSNVTLLLLPEEAEIIVLAQNMGQLYLTLRNPEDITIQEERGRATLETLLTGERLSVLHKMRSTIITVVRGTHQSGAVIGGGTKGNK